MKLLRISDSGGEFLAHNNQWSPVEQITKEDLLRLANKVIEDENVEFDAFDEQLVKSQAQRVIYKNLVQRLLELQDRRGAFLDQSARMFYQEYEGYRKELPPG